jgi:hypothetical protein
MRQMVAGITEADPREQPGEHQVVAGDMIVRIGDGTLQELCGDADRPQAGLIAERDWPLG